AHLLGVAKDVVEKKTKDSVILDNKAEDRIPKYQDKGALWHTARLCDLLATQFSHCSLIRLLYGISELTLGKVLGRGGFCVVNEVTKITLAKDGNKGTTGGNGDKKSSDEHYIANIVQDRGFMAQHCIRQGKDYRYAIKMVQDSSRKDPHIFINAVVDLAVESRFLAVVRHPNIIKMRAMDATDPFQPKFFVVLDRLYDIMPVRLRKWKKQSGGGFKALLKSKKAKEAFFVERLTVAYDIACALSYLHGLKYVKNHWVLSL
ncbi:MAG: hypothetical protein SGILL_003812, partial [Bacillariaceae sp.]